MIIKKCTYHIFLFLCCCAVSVVSFGQSIEITTDKNQILIGEKIEYDLLIKLPVQGYAVNFGLPDSIPHFEMLEKGDFDTLNRNGAISLRKKIIFTSFDSGSWYIPALPVTLEINNNFQKLITDSVLINVNYETSDTTGLLRDIKPIMEVKVKDYFWMYIIGGLLTILIICLLIYNYFSKRDKKPVPVLHSELSPYEEAMKDIKTLSSDKRTNAVEIKQFHTQLAFILKRYYSRITDNNLLNMTTGGLLLKLTEEKVGAGLLSTIAEALRTGDAVKFAKYMPASGANEQCLSAIKEAIEKIEKSKPEKK